MLSKLFSGTSFEYRFEMGSILIRKVLRKQEQEQMVVQGTVYDDFRTSASRGNSYVERDHGGNGN